MVRLPRRLVRSLRTHGFQGTLQIARKRLRDRNIRIDPDRYQVWIEENQPSSEDLCAQRAWSQAAGPRPTITLILPLAEQTPLHHLRDTVSSLLQQSFPRWQLCIATHPAEAEPIKSLMHRLAGSDTRLVVTVAPADRSRDSYLDAALEAAGGDFVAVVQPGDLLAPHALYHVARALLDEPDSDVVYSDEDCLSSKTGQRFGLALKPDWSPELMLAYNYLGRLTVMRRSLLMEVGGFDGSYGEAQEWDLLLRLSERTSHIHRILKCLYHRQTDIEATPAASPTSAAHLYRQAVRAHLARRGLDAQVETMPNGTQRLTWPVAGQPLVSIIVPTRNHPDLIEQCVEGLVGRTAYPHKEIILVDNNSTDPAVHDLYQSWVMRGLVRVVPFNHEFNYSAACNTGYRSANGELLLFLNNDIEILEPDWLDELVRWAQLPGVGGVGTKLIYPNGQIQHAGVIVGMHPPYGLIYNKTSEGTWGVFGSADVYRNYAAIMGACQLMPRRVFEEVGGFDERYHIANSDVAICLRAWKAGYRTVYTPYAALIHHEGYTRGKVNPTEDMEMTAKDLRELEFTEDPYFHPALSPHLSTPTLRLAPEPSPRDHLQQQLVELYPPHWVASDLDIYDDEAIREALGPHVDQLSFPIWFPSEVAESPWGAARFALHLLRTLPHLRRQYPRALSEGPSGDFCRWLSTVVVSCYGLEPAAAEHIAEAFRLKPAYRIRQVYELRADLRRAFPLALTPAGRKPFFIWLVAHGKLEYGLRDEQIWWFLQECDEDPGRELAHIYLITPEWQRRFPDAPTVFGRPRFLQWLRQHYDIDDSWLDSLRWPSRLDPLQELSLAYASREHWRITEPHALANPRETRRLAEWLRRDGHPEQAIESPWWQQLEAALTQDRTRPLGMNILGHFFYPSGLQVSARSVVEALTLAGVPTSCRDVPATVDSDVPGRSETLGLEIFDTTLIHVQPEPFFDTCYLRAGLEPRNDVYRIAMWYWEFGTAPPEWGKHAKLIQEVWAPTRFIAQALEQVMPVPVNTMLPGIRLGNIGEIPRSRYGIPSDHFMFLYMFDMKSITERKNPLGLIAAFDKAFRRDEDAVLVIKVSRGSNHEAEFAQLANAADRVGAIIIDATTSLEEAYGLIQACDCYVSLHRSEGFGLTMAEAMLMRKPVIATGYSGNLDFMTPDTSLLVPYQLVALERDIPPYKKGYEWADPSVTEAARWMRWVYEHPQEAEALGAKAQQHVRRVLSPEAAAQRIVQRLEEIRQLWTATPKKSLAG
jgi:GT2 family glycosyltransferase/glycosyltransferase involved in cell wall biosynthesis